MQEQAQVYTSKGLLPRIALEVRDVVTETHTSRAVATEWYYQGELVRRDAWVNLYCTEAMSGEQAQIT